MISQDEKFMLEAVNLAKKAAELGEVPVGAVVVLDGQIIASAYNRRETDKNSTSHAELSAIALASKKLGGWRLHKCDLYVTLEPCPMCAGAIVNSRIKRVVIGAKDSRAGAFGSLLNLNFYPLNHKPEIVFGVLENESVKLLKSFFSNLRNKQKSKSKADLL